jgi:hypothetical protein
MRVSVGQLELRGYLKLLGKRITYLLKIYFGCKIKLSNKRKKAVHNAHNLPTLH